MMKINTKILGLSVSVLLVCLLVACTNRGVASGKTVVQINGKKITEGDLDFLSTLNPTISQQLATPFGKREVVENLVEQELLYQAAKHQGLHREPPVQAKIELYKKVILGQAYLDAESLKEAQNSYEQNKNEYERLKFSHILLRYATPGTKGPDKVARSEPQALALANQIVARLQKGEDFSAVARDLSEDLSTKMEGGDFGYVTRHEAKLERRGFAPLLEKAFEMKVGEVSGPIKTATGYHLITVTAPKELPPFDEIKDYLVQKVKRELRGKILARLKETNKIVYDEAFAPERVTEPTPEVPPETPPDHPEQHPTGESAQH